MIQNQTRFFAVFALALSVVPAIAGPLSTDPNAYNDGSTIWHGSTPFSNGTLVGYVDWAVYDPAHAPAGLVGLAGYLPTPGEMLYTYQVFETGAAALSTLSVDLVNPADNIGTFTATGVTGQVASSANLIAFDSATWRFAGIGAGVSSVGLAFSSPNVPMNDTGTTLDHGQVSAALPLPSPSPVPIPEPGTLVLAGCGLATLSLHWLRRRIRRGV
jgi:hypothetical protein